MRVDAQQMVHRRQQRLGRDRPINHVAGNLIRRTDNVAFRDYWAHPSVHWPDARPWSLQSAHERPLRGTILHKLMEEVLTDEVADDLNPLEARSAELLAQLGETAAEDPAKGLVPNELARVIVSTLALPEVSALRDRLRAEFTVFGHHADTAEVRNEIALSGITDAVALAPDGKVEVVVDWKSDVSPTNSVRENYRTQVRDYLDASGATRGLVVYMTLGQVEEISWG